MQEETRQEPQGAQPRAGQVTSAVQKPRLPKKPGPKSPGEKPGGQLGLGECSWEGSPAVEMGPGEVHRVRLRRAGEPPLSDSRQYRGTSLIRNCLLQGSYSRCIHQASQVDFPSAFHQVDLYQGGHLSGEPHPGVELRANLKSISHRCHLFEVAFVWELTKETIHLPLGCLQGGFA